MRLRWMFGAVLLLATLATSGQTLAAGKDSGRLAALAARQDLCDMVCFAMTEGHMNPVLGFYSYITERLKNRKLHIEAFRGRQRCMRRLPD